MAVKSGSNKKLVKVRRSAYARDKDRIICELKDRIAVLEDELESKRGDVGSIGAADRRLVEGAFLESEERLKLYISIARMGTFDWDIVNDQRIWSPETYEIYGVPREMPLTFDLIRKIRHPDDLRDEQFTVEMDPLISHREFMFEYRVFRLSDGVMRWINQGVSVFFAGEGSERRAVRMLGVVQDITERKQAEEALRESEEKFRSLAETSSAVIYVYQGEDLIYVNNAAERITGYSREELLRKNFWEIFHPDVQGLVRERGLARQRDEPVPSPYEVRFRSKSGETRWAELAAVRIVLKGMPAGIATFFDITDRKQAEDALRQANLVVENSPVVLFRWKAVEGWPVALVSRNVSQFGYDSEELLSGTIPYASIIFKEDLGRVASEVFEYSASGVDQFIQEYRIVARDGGLRWVYDRTTIERDADGWITHYQGIVIDITERKRSDELLKNAKAQAELYLDLMGHDINNMHHIALGYLEMAREIQADTGRTQLIDTSMEVLQRSASLIQNVKKIQNLQEGLLPTQVVDVCELLSNVQREFRGIPHKEVRLNLNGCEHSHVLANELLSDVFVNLLSNAIKYTGDSAAINIDLEIVKNDSRRYYRVSFEDNGPGIPDEFKGKIFNRMLQGTDKVKGTGLGLYLVKSLVDSYGGRVWVEDKAPGDHTKGAKFVVMIPAIKTE